jgi:hypothetical protein
LWLIRGWESTAAEGKAVWFHGSEGVYTEEKTGKGEESSRARQERTAGDRREEGQIGTS